MEKILYAIAVLGVLGAVFGGILAVASKIFAVKVDERLPKLTGALPGANCGGCGFAGCGAYAEAVLKGEAPVGKCASGGNEAAKAMAAIMGVEAGEVTRKVALVRCSGARTYDAEGNLTKGAKMKATYEGFHDCLAASRVGGSGPLSCKFGCLGYGSCTKVCKYGAISVKNGVAVVDEDLCVGCMACAQVCPRKIITAVEPSQNVIIACNSLAKGAVTNRACTVGCIGCGKCMKNCPSGAITITNNLAQIDSSKCTNCGECAKVCPKGLIKDSNVENLGDPKPVITPAQ